MKHNVLDRSFVPRKLYPRGAQLEPTTDDVKLFIERLVTGENSQVDLEHTDRQDKSEAYTIEVAKDGGAMGRLHASEAFAQLFFAHSSPPSGSYTPYTPVLIKDSPMFGRRGLNFDNSRN